MALIKHKAVLYQCNRFVENLNAQYKGKLPPNLVGPCAELVRNLGLLSQSWSVMAGRNLMNDILRTLGQIEPLLVADLKAACALIQAKVHLAGTIERCIDYNQGLLALSTPPGDADWGHQSMEEWTKLIATLKSAGEMPGEDKPVAAFFTNDYVPK